jgi:hypothetical protein
MWSCTRDEGRPFEEHRQLNGLIGFCPPLAVGGPEVGRYDGCLLIHVAPSDSVGTAPVAIVMKEERVLRFTVLPRSSTDWTLDA